MKQSSRAKGAAYELKAQKTLEALGFAVEKANARIVWVGPGQPRAMHHDFFGIGDLLAFKSDAAKIVQVKFQDENTGLWIAEVRRKMAAFKCPPWLSREIWIYSKHGHRVALHIEVVKDIQDAV